MSNIATDGAPKANGRDVGLVLLLGSLGVAQLVIGFPTERDWARAPANALLGLNVLMWGGTFALAYRAPQASALLWRLSSFSKSIDRLGPLHLGNKSALAIAVLLVFSGSFMLATGAGWL